MFDYADTYWLKLERFGSITRGQQLVSRSDGRVLGTVEPYRGSKSWWIDIKGLDPLSYTHLVADKRSARRRIKLLLLQTTESKENHE